MITAPSVYRRELHRLGVIASLAVIAADAEIGRLGIAARSEVNEVSQEQRVGFEPLLEFFDREIHERLFVQGDDLVLHVRFFHFRNCLISD